ncbi:MAG: SPOR domain-containing protein [Candidatus Omnitrophica bacterium]|nr:SPOR domain-containing protein [Candidatus Omnitrophota bacterium]
MENENYSQLELFSASAPAASPKNLRLSSRVLSFLRHYERVILVVMGLLITSVIAFSFGVERGKRCVVNFPRVNLDAQASVVLPSLRATPPKAAGRSNPAFKIASVASLPRNDNRAVLVKVPKQPVVSQVQAFTPLEKTANRERNSLTGFTPTAFTVQIASYVSRDHAQKEAISLSKRGIPSTVIPKGKYFILCAGNFSNRQAAETFLTKLKKQYRDCQVRKM